MSAGGTVLLSYSRHLDSHLPQGKSGRCRAPYRHCQNQTGVQLMTKLEFSGLPHRDGVLQTFQRVASVADEIADKAAIYRNYADRLRELIAEQDVAMLP